MSSSRHGRRAAVFLGAETQAWPDDPTFFSRRWLQDFDLHFQWAVANPAAPGGFVTTQGLSVEVR